jgi:Cu-Zn family superoxide dismutase
MARLVDAEGNEVGSVSFAEMASGVNVVVEATGLPPGPHAIHVHQVGACSPDFDAAGEHLAPDGGEHGFAKTEAPHSGDLPNLHVAEDGTANAEFLDWRLTMDQLLDEDGSALIVHETADDYMESSSAGGRLACGVVEQMT